MSLRAYKGQGFSLSVATDAALEAIDNGTMLNGEYVWSNETGGFFYEEFSTAPLSSTVLPTHSSQGGTLPGRFIFNGISPNGPVGGTGTVTTVVTNTTPTSWNTAVLVDASAGPVTITLPTAVGNTGRWIEVKKIDSSTNAVTVDGNGAETIDGSLTYVIGQPNEAVIVMSDGANVKVLATAKAPFVFGVVTTAVNTTLTSWGQSILVDASAGPVTITLATAVGSTGKWVEVKKTDATVNSVTVDASGAETIDGSATYVLGQPDESIVVESDGTNGQIIASAKAPFTFGIVNTVANVTLTSWGQSILVDASAGAVTVTLATAVGSSGKWVEVKKTDSSINSVTVDASGAETIDGSATYVLGQPGESVVVESDGVNGQIIASAKAPFIFGIVNTAVNVTLMSWGQSILVDASAGPVTVTLATAVGSSGKWVEVKKTDATTNAVTVDANGAETIDGSLTYVVGQPGESIVIESDGANGQIIASAKAPFIFGVVSTAVNTTLTSWGQSILVDASAGPVTITLATAVGSTGKWVEVKKTDSTTNAVTIDPSGAQTIDGAATYTVGQPGESIVVESDGTNVQIIASAKSPFVFGVSSVAVNTTLTSWGNSILVDASAGPITITLATAVGNTGKWVEVKKTDSTDNTVTVDGSGAQTIDGAPTYTLQRPNESVVIESDGANGKIIATAIAPVVFGVLNTGLSTILTTEWGFSILVDASGGAVTITLPTALGNTGKWIEVKKVDSTDNAVTVDGSGAETIDGALTYILQVPNHSVIIESDGANNRIIATANAPAVFGVLSVAASTILTTEWGYSILVDASGGAATITLPTAVGNTGKWIEVKKTDSTDNAVTVDGSGAETIDGALTYILQRPNESVVIESDGTNDKVIATANASVVFGVLSVAASTILTTEWGFSILVDASGGAVTMTLPTAVGNTGKWIEFKKTDSSTNAVTLDASGAQTIDGALTYVITGSKDSVILESDGTNLQIVADYGSTSKAVVTAVAGATTLTSWNVKVLADATAGNVTINLPTVVGNLGEEIEVVRTDSVTTNTVTVVPNGAETINATTSVILYNQNDAIVVQASTATASFITADDRHGDEVLFVSANTTLTAWDKTVQVNCGGGNITITLPSVALVDATGSPANGRRIRVIRADNVPTNTLTVAPFAGEFINFATTFVLYNQNHEVTIEADAANTNSVVVGEFRRGDRVQTLSANTTITNWDQFVDADATAGSITITLPAGNVADNTGVRALGRKIRVRRLDNVPANTVTVAAAGGQTINSKASIVLYNQFDAFEVESTDTTDLKIVDQVRAGDRVRSLSASTTLTEWGEYVDADATAGSITITLPAAGSTADTTGMLPRGRTIKVRRIDNVPANTVTVIGSGGNTINGVASVQIFNQFDDVVVESDGSADIKVVSQIRYGERVRALTGATTLTEWSEHIDVDASGGAVTITLPSATAVDATTGMLARGRRIVVKKTDSSANYVTVAPSAGQTIDTRTTFVIQQQNEAVEVESDGTTNVHVIGQYRPAPLTVTAVKSGAYTTTYGELVRVSLSGGAFTVTLPTLTGAIPGIKIGFKHTTSNATNSLTVAAAGGNTIDGAATFVMTGPFFYFELSSNGGTDWQVQ